MSKIKNELKDELENLSLKEIYKKLGQFIYNINCTVSPTYLETYMDYREIIQKKQLQESSNTSASVKE